MFNYYTNKNYNKINSNANNNYVLINNYTSNIKSSKRKKISKAIFSKFKSENINITKKFSKQIKNKQYNESINNLKKIINVNQNKKTLNKISKENNYFYYNIILNKQVNIVNSTLINCTKKIKKSKSKNSNLFSNSLNIKKNEELSNIEFNVHLKNILPLKEQSKKFFQKFEINRNFKNVLDFNSYYYMSSNTVCALEENINNNSNKNLNNKFSKNSRIELNSIDKKLDTLNKLNSNISNKIFVLKSKFYNHPVDKCNYTKLFLINQKNLELILSYTNNEEFCLLLQINSTLKKKILDCIKFKAKYIINLFNIKYKDFFLLDSTLLKLTRFQKINNKYLNNYGLNKGNIKMSFKSKRYIIIKCN